MPNLEGTIGIIPGKRHISEFEAALREATGAQTVRHPSGATRGHVLTTSGGLSLTVHYRHIPTSPLDGENSVIRCEDPATLRKVVSAFGGFANGNGHDRWVPLGKSRDIVMHDVERLEVDLVDRAGLESHEAELLRSIMESGRLDAVMEILSEHASSAPAPGH